MKRVSMNGFTATQELRRLSEKGRISLERTKIYIHSAI